MDVLVYDNASQSAARARLDTSSLASAFGQSESQIASGDTNDASIQRNADGSTTSAAPTPGSDTAVSTAGEDDVAAGVTVSAPYPNPASGRSAIDLQVERGQPVTVEVFDALGRQVAVAHSGDVAVGQRLTVDLPTGDLAPGVYVVRVAGESFQTSRRLTVVR